MDEFTFGKGKSAIYMYIGTLFSSLRSEVCRQESM